MNLEKYTQKSREALASAQQIAMERSHQELSGKHLMAALLDQENGFVGRICREAGADPAVLRQEVEGPFTPRSRGARI